MTTYQSRAGAWWWWWPLTREWQVARGGGGHFLDVVRGWWWWCWPLT